jgi:hypothetical protein
MLYSRCRRRRREEATPTASSRPGEDLETLLDGGEAAARRIEGGGGSRVSGGDALGLEVTARVWGGVQGGGGHLNRARA